MKTPVIVTAAAAATLVVGLGGAALAGGWDKEGLAMASRLTARWSFLWFIAAWSASSLAILWPGGWRTRLLRRRRAVGLGFAAAHFVHAGFFLTGIFVFSSVPPLTTLVGGSAGYVFVAAMAATSNDASVKALGRRGWKLLHSVGGWVIAGIFFVSYLGRLEDKLPVGVYGVGLLALAVALRIAAFAKGRSRLQAA